jgi:hypothetical protein
MRANKHYLDIPWRIFAKFQPENYDFDLYKGFFMKKKKEPNSPDFEEFFFSLSNH